MPTTTDYIAQIGATSNPWFSELLPLAEVIVGLLVAGMLLAFLIYAIQHAFVWLFTKKEEP